MQRVSLITLVYFFFRSIIQLFKQASNFLPVIIILFAVGDVVRTWLLLAIGVALPVGLVAHAGLSWWYFRYEVSNHTLHIRDGILKRKQLTLDYARIQQADVREPWYFRPFKLAILGVESAGSDSKEVELAGIDLNYAHNLKGDMLAFSEQNTSAQSAAPAQPSQASPSLSMQLPLKEVARFGLMHNPILLLLPIIAYPLTQADNVFDDYIWPYLEQFLSTFENVGDTASGWLFITLLIAALALIIVSLSVVLAIVRFYKFTLLVHDGRYQAKAGLFTVTSRGFQFVRLQRVVIQQGLIARFIKRVSMRVNQTGHGRAQQMDKVFFVPVLNKNRQQQLHQELGLEEPTWRGVHPASMIVPTIFSTLFISLIAFGISGFDLTVGTHALWISALVACTVQFLGWRKRALFLGDKWLATRSGVLGIQQRFIPSTKIQALRLHQGPWLRVWGTASLHVYSAAGRETIAWLPKHKIEALRDSLISRSAEYTERWM